MPPPKKSINTNFKKNVRKLVNNGLLYHYDLLQYMFCTERNESSDNKFASSHWKYTGNSVGLILEIRFNETNKRVEKLGVYKRDKILEELTTPRRVEGFRVMYSQDWILFSWPIGKTTRKFQIRFNDLEERAEVVEHFRQQCICISEVEIPLVENSGEFLSQSTLVESQHEKGSSFGDTSSVMSFNSQQGVISRSVQRRINENKPFSFEVQTYSYCDEDRRLRATQRQTVWIHVGIRSGLCLVVVPKDRNNNPIIHLQSRTKTLESFVPAPSFLKVYMTDTLVLMKYKSGSSDLIRCIQVELNAKDVNKLCQCLAAYGVFQASVAVDDEGETTRSCSTGFDTRYFSDTASTMSRSSRFFERRRKVLGL